jgi:hypothetical protein
MPAHPSPVDGARVLRDLNALRAIGAYKTGVHKPTFSDAHMRSLNWLLEQFGAAELNADIDGIGNVVGRSAKAGPKLLAGSHLESQNYAGWLDGPLGVVYALEAARVINPDPTINGAVEVAAGATRKDISASSSAAVPISAASARPTSMRRATAPAIAPCGRQWRALAWQAARA